MADFLPREIPPQIEGRWSENNIVPGYPHISLADRDAVTRLLLQDLVTPALDALSPKLHWIPPKSGKNITTLSEQPFHNRKIVITEDPELRMVIDNERIFLKPVPLYLMSRRFCEQIIYRGNVIKQAELGFLKSYYYFIQHFSDYAIAQQNLLITNILYEDYANFATNLNEIGDESVSPRYKFGALNLSRLNILGSMFLHSSRFHIAPNYLVGSAFVFGFLLSS